MPLTDRLQAPRNSKQLDPIQFVSILSHLVPRRVNHAKH
jgi:hypothetical protein